MHTAVCTESVSAEKGGRTHMGISVLRNRLKIAM